MAVRRVWILLVSVVLLVYLVVRKVLCVGVLRLSVVWKTAVICRAWSMVWVLVVFLVCG